MSKVVIITVGSRDVQISKELLVEQLGAEEAELAYTHPSRGRVPNMLARPGGDLLLKNLPKLEKGLKFPIVTPFLEFILRSSQRFDKVILVATNQGETTPEEFRVQDTTYFAELLRHYLRNFRVGGTTPFVDVRKVEVTENVVYLDAMFQFFGDRLQRPDLNFFATASEIHVCNQGGIDAINTALMLQLLYRFGEKTVLYNVNEQTSICNILDFQHQFGFEQEKQRLRLSISRFDFAAARSLKLPPHLTDIAAYAESRLNFDFATAGNHLGRLPNRFAAVRDVELLSLRATQLDENNLTAELYWNAIIRYHQAAYVDFVQRFFRIVEQLSRSEVQKYIDFTFDHHTWGKSFAEFLDKPEQEDLKKHLICYRTPSGASLVYSNANIEVFMAILCFKNQEIFNFLTALRPMAQLRNNGIGAHGFRPVSKDNILSSMNMTEEEFERTLEKVGELVNAGENPFLRIQEHLNRLIEQV
jgi:hypothetical protein